MAVILVQPDLHAGSVALGTCATRILAMVKKPGSAYRRQAKVGIGPKTHFLREWRERENDEFPEGMSQEVLAERSGLSVASISAYERSKNDPSLDALQKLSKGLGVPRGMITDINPDDDPELWAAYLRANKDQRHAMGRMAAGLVTTAKRRAK